MSSFKCGENLKTNRTSVTGCGLSFSSTFVLTAHRADYKNETCFTILRGTIIFKHVFMISYTCLVGTCSARRIPKSRLRDWMLLGLDITSSVSGKVEVVS